ncbi:transcriptional regulator [Alkalihalobacillus alcalophilus ATCC 27647 = CGMCC 1.3604]|uniref:Transcriptional regulator n=1 Tax=Alkalihalobacillus alcalophilus ATCC 27647 = CGMCC 1.3604 TaxID=1218173 RepID=A0A094WIR6_ALKAL|nr:PadR family transcriptional regulator [Alkalihalobacillus alcalophilus]KGA95823.1 transcriptional regulator [Alkalihalobacillus alcalophilus ATCC 27647 = CGMCC 1.3604]MED1562954.1 PadR family transcriptional regulator [Alkalihalobacillus alcalophilus]THG91953.1 transcriptional regulator [Alkalihalobacillus alcalophilus ATCC 27647 = CGMCC 1.3604]
MAQENHTKYAILGILTTSCNSGYEIKQMIDNSLNHFWKISYGQIYPMLKTLVTDELAYVVEVAQENKPDKKTYFITEKGRAVLQNWLETPIEKVSIEKNELLLKLFFSSNQKKEQLTIKHIEQYIEKLQERLAVFLTIEQSIHTHGTGHLDEQYWLITLDYGKRATQAAIEWGNAAIATIKGGNVNGEKD